MISFDVREDSVAMRLAQIPGIADRRKPDHQTDDWLTVALEDSFPCSDPISSMRVD